MIDDTQLSALAYTKDHEKTVQILTLTFDLRYYMIFKPMGILLYIICRRRTPEPQSGPPKNNRRNCQKEQERPQGSRENTTILLLFNQRISFSLISTQWKSYACRCEEKSAKGHGLSKRTRATTSSSSVIRKASPQKRWEDKEEFFADYRRSYTRREPQISAAAIIKRWWGNSKTR